MYPNPEELLNNKIFIERYIKEIFIIRKHLLIYYDSEDRCEVK